MRIPIEADTDGNENLTDFHSKVKEVGFDFPAQNRYTSTIINLRAERAMAGMPNMQGMMKQLQKVQEKIARAQEELEGKTVVGEDLVLAAANKALDDAGKMAQEEMAKATNGMLPSIPGLSMPGF
jgi:DNA-binding protein YbaB